MVYISQVTEHTINVWFVRIESYSLIYMNNTLHYKNVIKYSYIYIERD